MMKLGARLTLACGLALSASSLVSPNPAAAGQCDAEAKLSLPQLGTAFVNFPTLSEVKTKTPAQLPEYERRYICNIQQAISLKGFLKRKNITGVLDQYTRTAIANFLDCYNTMDSQANGYEPNSSGLDPDEINLKTIEENFESFEAGYGLKNMETCKRKYHQDTTIAQTPKAPLTPPVTPPTASPTPPTIPPVDPLLPPVEPPAEPTVTTPPIAPVTPKPKRVKGCRDVTKSKNRDIIRNLATFKKNPHLCLKIEYIKEHGTTWAFYIIANQKKPNGPTWSLPHDNENAAFNTGLSAVLRYGGKMIAINTGERRHHITGQDPNRNFGVNAAQTRSCRSMRKKPAPKFTRKMMSFYKGSRHYLSLHNNTNGGGISAAIKTPVMLGLMSKTRKKGLSDPDDAILIAGLTSFKRSAKAQKAVKYFHSHGVNVIYEHIRRGRSDCSMSNYILLNRSGSYYNIEAQHGHPSAQRRMIDILMKYLNYK